MRTKISSGIIVHPFIILNDETFRTQFGLSYRNIATVGPGTQIDQRSLFAAVRKLLESRKGQSVNDLNGQELVVEYGQDEVIVSSVSEQGEMHAHLSDLMILSPHSEKRMLAFNNLIDQMGPTAPDFAGLNDSAEQRDLSNNEIEELLADLSNEVATLQRHALAACQASQASLSEIAPVHLTYFEKFCGPAPKGMDVDEYLTNLLPEYRKQLLRRDLARGLDICLLGAIRDDLAPGSWIEDISDDEVWDALTACDPKHDPFSLIAALDIAITRQEDPRYKDFADDAVLKLIQGNFTRPDGLDVYELMPVFAELVLNRIKGGSQLAPPGTRYRGGRFTRSNENETDSGSRA